MLQQTQVDRVLPKYQEWLRKYPSLEALASADQDDVTETWRPLGYNIRPRLHAIARESVERYGGHIPSDEERCCPSRASGLHRRRHPQLRVRPACAILDTKVGAGASAFRRDGDIKRTPCAGGCGPSRKCSSYRRFDFNRR